MTGGEYQQLVEFLGAKFDAMDGRFDTVEGRLTRLEVLNEERGHQIELVAEGLTSFREEVGRRFDQVDVRFEGVDAQLQLIRASVRGHGVRIERIERLRGD